MECFKYQLKLHTDNTEKKFKLKLFIGDLDKKK